MTTIGSSVTHGAESSSAVPAIIPISARHDLPIKLSHRNFTSWRAHLLALLRGHNLLGIIDGSKPCPPRASDGSNDAAIAAWHQQDQLLLAAIFGSLTAEIMPLVSSASTASEAWAVLTRLCMSKSRSRVNNLKSELFRVQIKDRSITEYLHHVKGLADELALIDEPVKADDLTLFIINGLGADYASIVGPIRARETSLKFEELHDLLCAHESALRLAEAATASLVATANVARSGQGRSSKSRGGGNSNNRRPPSSPSGLTNQQPSWTANPQQQAPWSSQPRNQGSGDSRPPPLICQLCGYKGHGALTCRRVPPPAAHFASSPTVARSSQSWMVDSGASHNLTADLSNLSIHSEYDGTDEVHIADGTGLPISHTGIAYINSKSRDFVLSDLLCVPSAHRNLLSVCKFTRDNDVTMEFFPSYFVVKDQATKVPLLKGPCLDGVYHLPSSCSASAGIPKLASVGVRATSPHWHARLGHPSIETSRFIIGTFGLPVFNKSQILGDDCISCRTSKSSRLPFDTSSFTAEHPLHYVFADVWGPATVSIDGSRYFLLLVDLYSRYCWLFPIAAKSEVANVFLNFRPLAEKQFGFTLRNLYSDNGGEFSALRPSLVTLGISWLPSYPATKWYFRTPK